MCRGGDRQTRLAYRPSKSNAPQQLLHRLLPVVTALLEHRGDVCAEVVLEQQAVQGLQRPLDRARLRDDVHAVLFALDHPAHTAHLAFEDAGAVQGALLDVFDHTCQATASGEGADSAPLTTHAEKPAPRRGGLFCKSVSAVSYSPTPSRVQYHRRWEA